MAKKPTLKEQLEQKRKEQALRQQARENQKDSQKLNELKSAGRKIEQEYSKPIPEPTYLKDIIKDVFQDKEIKDMLQIGVKHTLTTENVIRYIRTHQKRTKLYKLSDYFDPAPLPQIEAILKDLYKKGIIKKDKNQWYSLKKEQ